MPEVLSGGSGTTCGRYVDDPLLVQFIGDLKEESPEFAEWFALHDIVDDSGVFKEFHHPQAGVLNFESSSFEVPDRSGLRLFVHVPAPGTATADLMRGLIEKYA